MSSYFMFGVGMAIALATIVLLEHIERRRRVNG
jgi:hypothetical protein